MCEKFIIIYYCIIYTYIFSAVKTLRKHIIFYPYFKNVDWKVFKVKDVPNDVVRVFYNQFFLWCLCSHSLSRTLQPQQDLLIYIALTIQAFKLLL